MIRARLLSAVAILAPRVPLRLGYATASLAAELAHLLARGQRRRLEANLRTALGGDLDDGRLRGLSRAAFRNLFWGYFELFHLPGVDLDELRRRGEVEGLEHLRSADGGDTGAVIVFAHSGNLEVLCQLALLQPERRFVVVVERMPDPPMHELMQRLRESQGLETVLSDRPVELLRRFREGANVILAGDLDTTGGGDVVELFGRPARLPRGAVKLAMRSGAPLLVVAGWRTSPRRPERYHARLDPPLALAGDPSDPDDVRVSMRRLARRLEEIIAARPGQWLAFREIWSDDREPVGQPG